MQSSNQYRLILWASFVFVAYLLYSNWVTANNPAPEKPVVAEMTTGNAVNAVNGDIPTLSTEDATNSIVHVRTNVYDIKIQTQGGDIVEMGLTSYPESLENEDKPYKLMGHDSERFRLNKTGLLNTDGSAANHNTLYVAEATEFVMKEGEDSLVVPLYYEDKANNVTYVKRYIFERDSFNIHFEQEVINYSDSVWSGKEYRQLVEKEMTQESSGFIGAQSYRGPVISFPNDDYKYEKIKYKNMVKKEGKTFVPREFSGQDGWMALIEQYFVVAWVPGKSIEDTGHLSTIETRHDQNGNNAADTEYVLRMYDQYNTEIAPGKNHIFESRFYAGPKDKDQLAATAEKLDLTLDYGWLSPISNIMLKILKFYHSFTGNWGWSIILLTITAKVALLYFANKGYVSMARMRHVTPKLQLIREQYADDKMKLQEEMMKLYRQEKINPLGGCWPIIIQIPIFIALFWMLKESVELRQAPWIFWIKDLSQMDPYFVLPILMGVTMFFQQRLNPAPTDPTQAKIIKWMPFVFTFMFMWFASGIVLYWVVNNLLTILQQSIIMKRVEAGDKKPAAADK